MSKPSCRTLGCNRVTWNGEASTECCRTCKGSSGARHGPDCNAKELLHRNVDDKSGLNFEERLSVAISLMGAAPGRMPTEEVASATGLSKELVDMARLRVEKEKRDLLDTLLTFYHGTGLDPALKIQEEGFRVDLSGTNAGTKLGDGVYLTTTLRKALFYATGDPARPDTMNPHGGVVLELKVNLGKCKELTHRDPMMRTWHKHGYDSAFSPGCPCTPECQQGTRCPRANGVLEEHCVRDPQSIHIVGMVLGNTGAAERAGYAVLGGRLVYDSAKKEKMEREAFSQAEAKRKAEEEAKRKAEEKAKKRVSPVDLTCP